MDNLRTLFKEGKVTVGMKISLTEGMRRACEKRTDLIGASVQEILPTGIRITTNPSGEKPSEVMTVRPKGSIPRAFTMEDFETVGP